MAVVVGALSVLVLATFVHGVLVVPRMLPASEGAPQVGEAAPAFTLADSDGRPVSLAELFSTPIPAATGAPRAPRGVLLIFYRGYW